MQLQAERFHEKKVRAMEELHSIPGEEKCPLKMSHYQREQRIRGKLEDSKRANEVKGMMIQTSGRLMHRPLEHDAAEWTLRVKTLIAKKNERLEKVPGLEIGMHKLMVSQQAIEDAKMAKAKKILGAMGLGKKGDADDNKRGVLAQLKAQMARDSQAPAAGGNEGEAAAGEAAAGAEGAAKTPGGVGKLGMMKGLIRKSITDQSKINAAKPDATTMSARDASQDSAKSTPANSATDATARKKDSTRTTGAGATINGQFIQPHGSKNEETNSRKSLSAGA